MIKLFNAARSIQDELERRQWPAPLVEAKGEPEITVRLRRIEQGL